MLSYVNVDAQGNVHFMDQYDEEMAESDVASIAVKIANGVEFVDPDDKNYDVISDKDGIVVKFALGEDEEGVSIAKINKYDTLSGDSVTEDDVEGEDDDVTVNPIDSWTFTPIVGEDGDPNNLFVIGDGVVEIAGISVDANTAIQTESSDPDDKEAFSRITISGATLDANATYDDEQILGDLANATAGGYILAIDEDEGTASLVGTFTPTPPAWAHDTDAGIFTYAQDDVTFTLQGAAFVDASPMDNQPDGVDVVDGKLVFGDGFTDTVDFHIAGTGVADYDTIEVNGTMVYVGQGDDDTDNGFEISEEPFETPWTLNADGSFDYDSDGTTFNINGVADADNNSVPDDIEVIGNTIYNVTTSAAINGVEIGVTEAEGSDGLVNIVLDDENNIATVAGVDDAATIATANFIDVADGVTGLFAETGTHNIEGREFTVTNDADGVSVALADDSVTGIGGLAAGASITGVGAAVAVTVEGASELKTTGVGQLTFTTNDSSGYVVTNNTVEGLGSRVLMKTSVGNYVVNGANLNVGDSTESIQGWGKSARIYTTQMALADTLKPSAESYTDTDVSLDASGVPITDGWVGRLSVTLDSELSPTTDFNFDSVNAAMYVTMLDADQNVTLPNSSSAINTNTPNVADVDASAEGNKNIKGGDRPNRLINESTNAFVNMRGGAGDDTYVAAGGHRETLDLQDGGADVVYAPEGANIINYRPDEGAVLRVDNPTVKILSDDLYVDANGNLTIAGGANYSINAGNGTDDEGNLVVNLADDDESITAAFTQVNSEKLDRSESSVDEILVGNVNDTLVAKQGAEILGGTGEDLLYVGAGDIANGGAGNDLIAISDVRSSDNYTTVQIGEGGGYDTVDGFRTGFDENDDVLSIPDTAIGRVSMGFSHDGDDLVVDFGSVRMTVADAFASNETAALADEDDDQLTTTAADSDTTEALSGVAQIRVENRADSNAISNYSIISNAIVSVGEDDDIENMKFVGLGDSTVSGIDFSNFDNGGDKLVVDLNDTDTYVNISAVQASDGEAELIGSTNSTGEIFVAGLGDTTLNANTGETAFLVGRNAATAEDAEEAKEGITTFVFGSGYGTNYISGFTALTADNEDIADRIVLNEEYDVNTVAAALSLTDNDLTLALTRRDSLFVQDLYDEGATEAQIQIDDNKYKVGSSMVYGEDVSAYIAQENGSIVADEDDDVENVEMWLGLNGYNDKTYTNIKDVDVSGAERALVAGNELENVIVGAAGSNSLWGGFTGENDTLIGNDEGNTTFFYTYGAGNDEVQSYSDDDVVWLLGIDLDSYDIDALYEAIGDESVDIKFNDGGSVKVNGTSEVTFQIEGGHQWTADRESKTFKYKRQV